MHTLFILGLQYIRGTAQIYISIRHYQSFYASSVFRNEETIDCGVGLFYVTPHSPQCNSNLLLVVEVTSVNNPRLVKSRLARPTFHGKSVVVGTVAAGNRKINKLAVPSL